MAGAMGYTADGSSTTFATTSMSAAELERAFAEQLREVGWNRTRGGADGPLAWSTWSLPEGPEWQGFMYVIDAPGENRRQLSLQVQSATSPNNAAYPYYPMIVQ